MTSDLWKDQMFREHAAVFRSILRSQVAQIDWGDVFGRDAHGEPQRFAVLDLGCGVGRLLPQFAAISSVTVGLDYSPELLAYAAELLPGLPNAFLVQADFRELNACFPADQFNAIVRAYTSLGYFDYATESNILTQCHRIAAPKAVIVLDTFNSAWFEVHRRLRRRTSHPGVELVEEYDWSGDEQKVYCVWTYNIEGARPIEIRFDLEGYGRDRVEALLRGSGWIPRAMATEYSRRATPISANSERIIAIAEKGTLPPGGAG